MRYEYFVKSNCYSFNTKETMLVAFKSSNFLFLFFLNISEALTVPNITRWKDRFKSTSKTIFALEKGKSIHSIKVLD